MKKVYNPIKCLHCETIFTPIHHAHRVCSMKCTLVSQKRSNFICAKKRHLLGEVYMNCELCGVKLKRCGNMQRYCGNRKDKNSCSYKMYRQRGDESTRKGRNNPIRKFKGYRWSAKKRNLDFIISFDEFMTFWGKDCFYCGDEIKFIGLDRVDNKGGYVMSNLVSCCTSCNFYKKNYSQSSFIEKCLKIAKQHIQREMTEDIEQEEKKILSQQLVLENGYGGQIKLKI